MWGLERGYCLMIGGEDDVVAHLDPIFAALAPGVGTIARTPGRTGDPSPAEHGYLHCGPNGAGHFVKMVHNGIEYGLMAAYAEGLNILKHADVGTTSRRRTPRPRRCATRSSTSTSSTSPTSPRCGGAAASSARGCSTSPPRRCVHDPELSNFAGPGLGLGRGPLDDPGRHRRGRARPRPSAALFERFSSRGQAEFADQLMSAMRYGFGGHLEKKAMTPVTDPVRRALLLRRHRRPRLQADLPGARLASSDRGSSPCPSSAWPSRAGPSTSCKKRAHDSLAEHGPVDESVFSKLAALLRYVDGDYNDAATFEALFASRWGTPSARCHYLAIPPSLFEVVAAGLPTRAAARTRGSSWRSRSAATWPAPAS